MTDNSPKIYAWLRYNDAPAAIEFLQRAFGFEEHMIVPGENGTVRHAELRLGDSIIMPGSTHQPRAITRPKSIDEVDFGIYIAIDDVDAHHDRAKAAGAEIVQEPYDSDHGSRDYSALDTEGYYWSFGTYRP